MLSIVRYLVLLGWYLAASCWAAASQTAVVRYYPAGDIYEYRWKLLELALEHTRGSDGPFRLQLGIPAAVSQDRSIRLLQEGQLDVLAFASNPEREAMLRPVRIDILRGILGYRVFLIRENDQARFARLDEKSLRKDIVLGFNPHWADFAILQANGFKVVEADHYDKMFEMLAMGRFDAFPRGINEAGREVTTFGLQNLGLAVEKSFALYMEFPVYFWVARNNDGLARRIERGLTLALADGSFKALFLRYHAAEIAQIKREKRRVIRLKNPLLPPQTPPVDTSWWWKP